MAKRDITMSAVEVDDFLAVCPHMVVGAIDADGWPVGTIAAVSYADGTLRVALDQDGAVAAALAADPRVCCTADVHESYYEIKGVSVLGALGDDATVSVERLISFDFGRLR